MMNWKLFIKRTITVLSCFLLYKYSKYFYAFVIFGKSDWEAISVEGRLTLMLISAIIFGFLAKWLMTKKLSPGNFGLKIQDLPKGILFAGLCALPLFIGLGFYSDWNFHVTGTILYRGFILAGFGEEFIYRAFLFGLLYYYAGWGFLSAGLIAGLFFGWGHLYQATDITSAIGIFLFTVGASIGFSWFYYAWNSLWMVIFLHAFMDIIWDSFHVTTDVTGNLWINIARFSTILLAVYVSFRIARSQNRNDLKQKRKLWINHAPLLQSMQHNKMH